MQGNDGWMEGWMGGSKNDRYLVYNNGILYEILKSSQARQTVTTASQDRMLPIFYHVLMKTDNVGQM